MPSSSLSLKAYSEPVLDPLPRLFMFAGTVITGGWLINDTIAHVSGMASRVFGCLGIGVFASIILIAFIFNYIEVDDRHIASIFRIGRLLRFELQSVRWDAVRSAEFNQQGGRFSMANLKLTTVNGKRFVFNGSAYGKCAENFEAIARHFHGKSA